MLAGSFCAPQTIFATPRSALQPKPIPRDRDEMDIPRLHVGTQRTTLLCVAGSHPGCAIRTMWPGRHVVAPAIGRWSVGAISGRHEVQTRIARLQHPDRGLDGVVHHRRRRVRFRPLPLGSAPRPDRRKQSPGSRYAAGRQSPSCSCSRLPHGRAEKESCRLERRSRKANFVTAHPASRHPLISTPQPIPSIGTRRYLSVRCSRYQR